MKITKNTKITLAKGSYLLASDYIDNWSKDYPKAYEFAYVDGSAIMNEFNTENWGKNDDNFSLLTLDGLVLNKSSKFDLEHPQTDINMEKEENTYHVTLSNGNTIDLDPYASVIKYGKEAKDIDSIEIIIQEDVDDDSNLVIRAPKDVKTLKDLFVVYTRDVVANKCTAVALRVGDKIVTGKIDGDDVSLDIVTIESIERKSTIMYDIKPFFSGTNSEYKYVMLNDVLVCLGR